MNPVLLLAILFIPSVILLFMAFGIFDELVEAEYMNDREAWIADGRPRGMFWSAPDSGFLQGVFARDRMMFRLVFRTPDWVKQSPVILRLLKRYRFCTIYWNISLLLFFGLFLYFLS